MPPEVILATLRRLRETLGQLDVPFALMGGLALATWKHPRFTKDLDLLVSLGETQTDDLLRVLEEDGFPLKRPEPLIRIGEMEFVHVFHDPIDAFVEVQIYLFLARTRYQREAIRRRVPVDRAELGFEASVLACEDLILFKLLAGRMIDLADCEALLRANRPSLDLAYFVKWVDYLGLRAEFQRVWGEAFPEERPPV